MRTETMTIYTRENFGKYQKYGKWKVERIETDKTEIYRSLATDLLHKKLHKCTYIRSITDTCNYDGTRTVTTYYDNNVKRVYVVED